MRFLRLRSGQLIHINLEDFVGLKGRPSGQPQQHGHADQLRQSVPAVGFRTDPVASDDEREPDRCRRSSGAFDAE